MNRLICGRHGRHHQYRRQHVMATTLATLAIGRSISSLYIRKDLPHGVTEHAFSAGDTSGPVVALGQWHATLDTEYSRLERTARSSLDRVGSRTQDSVLTDVLYIRVLLSTERNLR